MNRVALTRALGYTPRNSITRASFVQLELAGRIGLTEGRYLVREDDAERVLIVQELDTPRPQRRGRRRARPVTRTTRARGGVRLLENYSHFTFLKLK